MDAACQKKAFEFWLKIDRHVPNRNLKILYYL